MSPAAPQKPNFNVTDNDFLAMGLDYDPAADANAQMPPVLPTEYVYGNRDQGYTCTAEFSGEWKPGVTPKDGKKYAQVAMLLTIQDCTKDPSMNGRKLRFDAKTLIFEGSKTSTAQSIIQAAGFGNELMTRPKTVQTLMELINHIVQTKRLIPNVLVDWEARFWDNDAKVALAQPVRGWEKFPKDEGTGAPNPKISRTVFVNNVQQLVERSAQNIVRFAPMGKPGQQTGAPVINLAPAMSAPVSAPANAMNAPAPNWAAQPQQPQQQPQFAPPPQVAPVGPPPGAQMSPDGQHYWNGQQWVPVAAAASAAMPQQPQQPQFAAPPANTPPQTYTPAPGSAPVSAPPVLFGT